MTTFVYGYDPICGWCYGAAPAIRAVAEVMPVRLVMAGLVVGPRVGPAAEMEGYVRKASEHLQSVTGRRPSRAFFDWMKREGSVAASGPPAVAVHAVMQQAPEATLEFAHALTEAHYELGLDPNDSKGYSDLLARYAPSVELPDLHDVALQADAFAEGRRIGLSSFPTYYIENGAGISELPTIYDPDQLVATVKKLMA